MKRARAMLVETVLAAGLLAGQAEWKTPALPDGRSWLTMESESLLRPPASATVPLTEGTRVAKTPPRVVFAFLPGQTYPGKPWSNWSDGCVLNGRYYTALSDHHAPDGNALLYEFDPAGPTIRILADVKKVLRESGRLAPGERYTPGKIHSRIMAGSDGWLYYATHRGNPREASDANGYRGDWILRTWPDPDPAKVKTEIVAAYPEPKHSIPAAVLDPVRMVFYAGTAAGPDAAEKGGLFLAVDARTGRILHRAPDGFDRYAILMRSTGRVYWGVRPEKGEGGSKGYRYDPVANRVERCPALPHVRACTEETADGKVYGVSGTACDIWVFDGHWEQIMLLGDGALGRNTYVTSLDVDPSGRYLYYVPGAHGGGPREGTPVMQFDGRTKQRKVMAFMNALADRVGAQFEGTFSTALSEKGDILFITWNMGRPKWDCGAVTAVWIPESERPLD